MRLLRNFIFVLFLSNPSQAQFVKVGTCQPAIDWGYPAIHSLSSAHGKVYMGYGEWNSHPGPVILTSYNPATGITLAEHHLNTDSIGAMREIDGNLFIPSVDPIHYQHFEDYTIVHPDGHIERRTPNGFYHLYDIFKTSNGDIFAVGSQGPNEIAVNNGSVFRSQNNGRSWQNIHPSLQPEPLPQLTVPFRYYWGFEDHRGIHFAGAFFDGTWDNGPYVFNLVDHVHQLGDLENRLTLMVVSKVPGIPNQTGTLTIINPDGTSQAIGSQVKDYALNGSSVFILDGSGGSIEKIENIRINNARTPFQSELPVSFESLHVLDGVLYGGGVDGSLYALRLDNGVVQNQLNEFQSNLPERAGEEIDIDGNRMVISVPRSSREIDGRAVLDAGKVLLYERPSPKSPWELAATLALPDEELDSAGSWFGSHVDLNGENLLVVSGGDSSGGERGNEAHAIAFSKQESGWIQGDQIPLRYAHDIALVRNRVFATAYRSSSRQSIVRFESTSFDGMADFGPANNLYHPYGVFSYDRFDQNRVFLGQTGDLSRGGGVGKVTIYDTSEAGLFPVQTIESEAGGQDRFGYSLDVKKALLAVGAPFGDLAGSQTGSVCLFRQGPDGNFAHEETISASDAEIEAHFGHAVTLTEGGLLYVSAPGATGANGRRGAVYAFRKNNGAWEEIAKFTPEPSETKTWEFGMTLEADGHHVMVASAQVDRSLPYLDRITILPPETFGFTEWAKFQGIPDNKVSAPSILSGTAVSQLEAYALDSHTGEAPHFQIDMSGKFFSYIRRTDAASRGLTYRAEISDDNEQWIEPETEISEPLTAGWERVKIPVSSPTAFGRVIVGLSE